MKTWFNYYNPIKIEKQGKNIKQINYRMDAPL